TVLGVPVIQSNTRGNFFGRIDLYVNKKTRKINTSLTRIHQPHWICGTWYKNEDHCDPKNTKERLEAGTLKPDDILPLRQPLYEGEPVQADPKVQAALQP